VAATLKDGHEGDSHPGDGYSEYGALYGIDLARPNGFTVHCAMPFQGGTAATPTVRADGKRVYTADAAGNALAFHTEDCSLVWSVPVGSQIVGSLSVSSVGGEIYASTASSVFKIVERDDSAALVWEARIAEAFHTGRLAEAVEPLIDAVKHYLGVTSPVSVSYTNFNLAATGENGVMIQAAAGVEFRIPPTPPATQPFPLLIPLAMSMTLLDRETGRPVNSTSAVEETFAAITSGPEGATAIGNSPFRRLMARAAIDVALDQAGAGDVARCVADWLVPPLTGGITKYGIAERFDLLARDAACGGSTRLANTLAHVINPVGIAGDIHDAGRLIRQAREATNTAVQRQEINRPRAAALNMQYAAAETALGNNNLDDAQRALARACSLLDTRP
jgi:hypothetical protein